MSDDELVTEPIPQRKVPRRIRTKPQVQATLLPEDDKLVEAALDAMANEWGEREQLPEVPPELRTDVTRGEFGDLIDTFNNNAMTFEGTIEGLRDDLGRFGRTFEDHVKWAHNLEGHLQTHIDDLQKLSGENNLRLNDIPAIQSQLIQMSQNIDACWRAVNTLQQQRGIAEVQMDRNTRSVALDLAIKTVKKEGETVDPVQVTALADAFIQWLRAVGP